MAAKTSAKKKKRKSKKTKSSKLTPQEIEQRLYRNEVRSIFTKSGFDRVPGVSDKQFVFLNEHTSDFDDVFIYKNVIVLIEYTVRQSSDLGEHLKSKKVVYDAILQNKNSFLEFYGQLFPTFSSARDPLYDNDQTSLVILYCPKNKLDITYKKRISNITYLDYPVLKYFRAISDSVKGSAKYEIFKFFHLSYDNIGENSIRTFADKKQINGTLLPETHSNFNPGYKVVSFYIDPQTLLTGSYVLRKNGWQDDHSLYQRMIVKNKINAIRKYLLKEKRVFINNIIVTLPPETELLNTAGKVIDASTLTKTSHVKILIPNEFNVIGLVDGQHRVFAYHEGGEDDVSIGRLRIKQNLLATGIIYPSDISELEKSKFEARLFLEINSTQTNAKSDLKQAISLILNPFSTESIATAVISKLNDHGPLQGMFEKYFFEKDKIKTTSIVSYGLKPIVKLSGSDSFFSVWNDLSKYELLKGTDQSLLNQYIDYCVTEINIFLGAIRSLLTSNQWSIDKKEPQRILSTTTINGFIIFLRRIIEADKLTNFNGYRKIGTLDSFNFKKYKSSQYGSLANDLFKRFP
ncbi:DGQHR domain-containing protein [Flavisolibacter nicotianae]|uniref:DGQHR domain-containing protein n=1 Tax=Flavisolibacter nicotianae TaxID=2364882 RepID=UPI000EAF4041|nr:DGQHR domain-containing protein [Flavisolibacter nicotianae]